MCGKDRALFPASVCSFYRRFVDLYVIRKKLNSPAGAAATSMKSATVQKNKQKDKTKEINTLKMMRTGSIDPVTGETRNKPVP